MRGGRKLALYLLHDVFIDDCLRRLAGDAAGNLRKIAATHIQLVGIEMHIAIGAAEVIHLRDKLIVKLRTPALQIALSCQLNVSSRYLAQVTRRISGKTPKAIIDEYIVKEIERELSTTTHTVQEIANTFGFSSQAHLTKFFKKMKGVTPSAFRQPKPVD